MPVAIKTLNSGLNNQRIALAGLAFLAMERKTQWVMPTTAVNFSPEAEKPANVYQEIPVWELFDAEVFAASLSPHQLSQAAPDEVLGMELCFGTGSRVLKELLTRTTPAHEAARSTLMGLVGASSLRKHAKRIADWLPPRTFALQLRIERDWREYLVAKYGTTEIDGPDGFSTCDPEVLAHRIARSQLPQGHIWACCDEADLVHQKDDIKASFAKYGFLLLFKSDLPADLDYPPERVKRAMIDFEICRLMQVYVGLRKSTFSETLWLGNLWQSRGATHYVFDAPGELLVEQATNESLP